MCKFNLRVDEWIAVVRDLLKKFPGELLDVSFHGLNVKIFMNHLISNIPRGVCHDAKYFVL